METLAEKWGQWIGEEKGEALAREIGSALTELKARYTAMAQFGDEEAKKLIPTTSDELLWDTPHDGSLFQFEYGPEATLITCGPQAIEITRAADNENTASTSDGLNITYVHYEISPDKEYTVYTAMTAPYDKNGSLGEPFVTISVEHEKSGKTIDYPSRIISEDVLGFRIICGDATMVGILDRRIMPKTTDVGGIVFLIREKFEAFSAGIEVMIENISRTFPSV